jgi:TonB family protein
MKALYVAVWLVLSAPHTAMPVPQTAEFTAARAARPPSTETGKTPCRNPDGAGKYHIGCGVTAPVILYQGVPEYTEEARMRKLTTNGIVISFTVDADGQPGDLHVKNSRVEVVAQANRPAQQLLEDKMMEAVRRYRFKPATFEGKNVSVEMNVEINISTF